MSVETLVPIEEYLRTSYDPDVEYVDGILVERNVGDLPHGLVQSNVIFAIRSKYPHVFVIPELRQRRRRGQSATTGDNCRRKFIKPFPFRIRTVSRQMTHRPPKGPECTPGPQTSAVPTGFRAPPPFP